jgi:hypothetical protein
MVTVSAHCGPEQGKSGAKKLQKALAIWWRGKYNIGAVVGQSGEKCSTIPQ